MTSLRVGSLVRGVVAAAALLLLAAGGTPAGAAPLAGATMPVAAQAALDDLIVQVRDGCGRGYRYSRSRDRCVPDFDDRRGPPVYRGPPPGPGVMIMPGFGGVVVGPDRRRPGCPRGMRWSERRGTCVWN